MTSTTATDAKTSELIDEIIRMSDFNFERLPMIDIIGARMADFLPISLSDLTRGVCEASLNQLDYLPLGQAISRFPDPCLIAMASSPVLDGGFLVVMDAPIILASLEMSLGGEPDEAQPQENSEFTAIERGFGSRLAKLILGEMRQSFSVIGDIAPELDSLETDAEEAAVAQQASLCVQIDLSVQVSTQSCRLLVVFPYDALEPIRPQLSKVYFGERGNEQSPWREALAKQIESSMVDLEAVLAEIELPMRQIMAFKPGDQIGLPVGKNHESTLFCADHSIFRCVTGTCDSGRTAIQITKEIEFREDDSDGDNDN